ncbi:MAG: phosphate ABC transporter substrate-binding protein [Candidatus Zhuqueibacterota bacterium]
MNTRYLKLLAIGSMILLSAGCSKKTEESGNVATGDKVTIQNIGSDTMVNLAQAWSEEYAKIEPNVSVEVSGGGSGTGFAALVNGTVDIVNASREITTEEKEKATANAQGQTPQEYIVGYDALAVYVHKENPLNEISIEQLAEIYGEGGAIEKWSQLGITNTECPNDEIIRISRQSNSGTYIYFREHVVGQTRDFKLGSTDLHGSKDVVELIGKTPCAIGYSGMGYTTPDVKMLKISAKTGGVAIPAEVETTLNKTYPIARPLYLYTHGVPNDATQKYINWILSDAGQLVIEQIGYVPLPKTPIETPTAQEGK